LVAHAVDPPIASVNTGSANSNFFIITVLLRFSALNYHKDLVDLPLRITAHRLQLNGRD
jgi:hypothetical protein